MYDVVLLQPLEYECVFETYDLCLKPMQGQGLQ